MNIKINLNEITIKIPYYLYRLIGKLVFDLINDYQDSIYYLDYSYSDDDGKYLIIIKFMDNKNKKNFFNDLNNIIFNNIPLVIQGKTENENQI